VSTSIRPRSPLSVLWTAPSILAASMLIAWAAESAQFFISQGVALAILAWMQTLPEFAVEAVLAWKQEVTLLLANLTGALRLLTGLGWPMIYCVAAYFYRRNTGRQMNEIRLAEEHCVEVVGLLASLVWAFVVWIKGTLSVIDGVILIAVYLAYLWVLRHMPAAGHENIDELERIPRAIVTAPRKWRIVAIAGLFLIGGGLIYASAEPFLGSLLAVSTVLGVPNFVFVQWVAPFVSEFPEKVSAFYWARTVERASMALMNMVSSNINQWTLLAAMLPIVYSMSRGTPSTIPLDAQQSLELLLTLGQSLLSAIFLINMRLSWWEAAGLFGLWIVQFAFTTAVHDIVTAVYFVWAFGEVARLVKHRRAPALHLFAEMWRKHVR
jgi:cation:H+ antiporter